MRKKLIKWLPLFTPVSSGTPVPKKPFPPTNLIVSQSGVYGDFTLSWDASPCAELLGYRVYKGGLLIGDVPPDELSFDELISDEGTYEYFVVGYIDLESDPSNLVQVEVLFDYETDLHFHCGHDDIQKIGDNYFAIDRIGDFIPHDGYARHSYFLRAGGKYLSPISLNIGVNIRVIMRVMVGSWNCPTYEAFFGNSITSPNRYWHFTMYQNYFQMWIGNAVYQTSMAAQPANCIYEIDAKILSTGRTSISLKNITTDTVILSNSQPSNHTTYAAGQVFIMAARLNSNPNYYLGQYQPAATPNVIVMSIRCGIDPNLTSYYFNAEIGNLIARSSGNGAFAATGRVSQILGSMVDDDWYACDTQSEYQNNANFQGYTVAGANTHYRDATASIAWVEGAIIPFDEDNPNKCLAWNAAGVQYDLKYAGTAKHNLRIAGLQSISFGAGFRIETPFYTFGDFSIYFEIKPYLGVDGYITIGDIGGIRLTSSNKIVVLNAAGSGLTFNYVFASEFVGVMIIKNGTQIQMILTNGYTETRTLPSSVAFQFLSISHSSFPFYGEMARFKLWNTYNPSLEPVLDIDFIVSSFGDVANPIVFNKVDGTRMLVLGSYSYKNDCDYSYGNFQGGDSYLKPQFLDGFDVWKSGMIQGRFLVTPLMRDGSSVPSENIEPSFSPTHLKNSPADKFSVLGALWLGSNAVGCCEVPSCVESRVIDKDYHGLVGIFSNVAMLDTLRSRNGVFIPETQYANLDNADLAMSEIDNYAQSKVVMAKFNLDNTTSPTLQDVKSYTKQS